MKISRRSKAISVVAASLVVLSACSSADESAEPATETESSGEVVEIEYLHRLPDGEGMTTVNEIVERWNAENPNIQVTATKFDGAAHELNAKVQTDLANDVAPCLFQAGYADLAGLYVEGTVQDVSEYAQKYADKFGEGPFNSMQVDGKYFGLPQDTGPLVYFYNKAEFEALGLSVPTTADEFIETAKTAAAQGKYIVSYQPDEASQIFSAMTAAAGGQWFGIDGDSWTIDFNDAGSVAVQEFWQTLLDADAAVNVGRWSEDWAPKLANKELIGTIGAAWEAPLLAGDMAGTDNEGNWAIAQLPDLGAGQATGPDGGSGVVVSAGCEHPAEAMEFNAWFNTQVDDLASQGLVVAAAESPAAPSYAEFYGGQDVLAEFTKANDAMNAFTYIPGWASVMATLTTDSAGAADGTSTVADVFGAAAVTAREALTNAGLTVAE